MESILDCFQHWLPYNSIAFTNSFSVGTKKHPHLKQSTLAARQSLYRLAILRASDFGLLFTLLTLIQIISTDLMKIGHGHVVVRDAMVIR